MSFWKTHQFKKLNRKWREKAKKSGFQDLERDDGVLSHDGTVGGDLMARTNFKPEIIEEVAQYFRWAEDMANHARFKSTLDKKIWTFHARGETLREIADHLPVRIHHTTVHFSIIRIRDYLRLQIQKKAA